MEDFYNAGSKMTVALLTLNLLSIVAIAVSVVYGILIPRAGALGYHLSISLVAVLLAVFTHTMTYFYFIGVGSSIRRAVEEYGTGEGALAESRRLKGRVLPWAGGAILLVMATFVLGGGAHTRAFPGWVHGAPGYLTLVFSVMAFFAEAKYLFRQNRVANGLQKQLASSAETSAPELRMKSRSS